MKLEELIIMWEKLGVSGGTAIIVLIALYFVIKWAVKNGVKEAYTDITGKEPVEDIKNENRSLPTRSTEGMRSFRSGERREAPHPVC